MREVPIRDESIRLGQFLKLADLVDTGADAKPLLMQGLVFVNGELETRRGSAARQGRRGEPRRRRRAPSGRRSCGPGRPWRPVDHTTSVGSADVEQVHHEDQGLAGLDDAAGATVAVPEVRRDHQLAPAADLHALHARVPAGDDLADAEAERQRLAAVVGGVELLAGGVRDPDVVDLTVVPAVASVPSPSVRSVTSRSEGGGESGKSISGFSWVTRLLGGAAGRARQAQVWLEWT